MQRNDINILIIDDEIGFCKLLSDILKDNGYSPTYFTNPLLALDSFKYNKYDIVITDIKMPEMDGLELFNELKKLDDKMPVIVVTGYATIDTVIEALRLGAFNFIKKPFSIEEILNIVRKAVKINRILWRKKEIAGTVVPKHEFSIPSDIEQIEPTVNYIIEIVSTMKPLNSNNEMDMASALTEAIANAIIHGNKNNPEKKVDFNIQLTGNQLEIKIRDQGDGFEASMYPKDVERDSILNIGGRGILMMNYYMNGVYYSDRGNEVMLVKEI